MQLLSSFRFIFIIAILLGLSSIAALSQTQTFGPVDVPGTSVIFDPDNVLTADQLAALRTAGSLSPTPAVPALRFDAAPGQTFTLSASGLVGCCSVANIGPDGYPEDPANITSLGSISGFNSPNGLPLVGVFTNGAPDGNAPPDYDYSAGLGQARFYPKLNQVFFIGDDLTGTGSGVQQVFDVPETATELWLGFVDGGTFQGPPANYGDNPGYLVVEGTLYQCSAVPDGLISSKTLATVPGIDSESRTCLGVGEQVSLNTDQPANWAITSTSNLARLSGGEKPVSDDPRFEEPRKHFPPHRDLPVTECDQNDLSVSRSNTNSICLSTPYENDQITVTAKFDNGSTASISFTVTQPTGLIFQRLEFPDEAADSDYLLKEHGIPESYQFGYSPAVFVVPGNVSFAYAGIGERDPGPGHRPGIYDPPFNLLFDLNGTRAWLTTCDKVGEDVAKDGSILYPFIFSPFNPHTEIEFSLVQTGWELYSDHFESQKGQTVAVTPEAFQFTPLSSATSAVLDAPYPSFYIGHDDWDTPVSTNECQEQVTKQFNCVSKLGICLSYAMPFEPE